MNKFYGYENEIKNQRILSVQINLLNQCPSKCASCRKFLWPHDKIPVKDVLNVLEYLKEQRCSTVFFSGGEPLFYSGFSDIIDYCEYIDMPYNFITTLICRNNDLLEKVARTAYRIHVSLDAVDKELYKEIRGIDAFDIVKNSIDIINNKRSKHKIPIRFSSTVGAYNYNKVFDIYNFAKENNCLINFYYMQLWDNLKMDDEKEKEFFKQLEQIINDENKNENYISNARDIILKKEKINKVEKCYVPQVSAIINCDGNIYPCCGLFTEFVEDYNSCKKYSYGNIINKNHEELKNEFKNRLQKYPLNCDECNECMKTNMRYNIINKNVEELINFKRQPVFI